jgi:hypothetical protein
MHGGEHASGAMGHNRDQMVTGVGRSKDLCRPALVQDADLSADSIAVSAAARPTSESGECRLAKNDPVRGGPGQMSEYLAWIRRLGCVVCARVSGGVTVMEAAHTNALGPRGLGQKTTDFSAIPLCADHHRENLDSYHRPLRDGFSQKHGIDPDEIVFRL